MARFFQVINEIEKAQLVLLNAQAYPNPELLQKAQQQLLLAQQLLTEIDKEELNDQQKQQIGQSKELMRHLFETKSSIDSI